jgi:hypothetical protein
LTANLKRDNLKYENINAFKLEQKKLFENININIKEKDSFLYNIFKYNNYINKNNKIKNKQDLSLNSKYKWNNIIKAKYNNIISRKMSNRLLMPHYFFPAQYNETVNLPQSRS